MREKGNDLIGEQRDENGVVRQNNRTVRMVVKQLIDGSHMHSSGERRIKLEQWYATASPQCRCHHLSELVLPARSLAGS